MARKDGDEDATTRASALAFLDELLTACGSTVDEVDVPIDELGSLTVDDLGGDPDEFLRRPGARARLQLLAARHRPTAEREHIDGLDVLDVRAWPSEPNARARFEDAFRREVVVLRGRIASPTPDPASLRIEPKQAIEHGAPEHGLPPTPKSTFYNWVQAPKNRELLGIEKRLAKLDGQPVLVSGLLRLHASPRRRTKLPARAPNAGRSGKRKGRK